MDQSTLLTYALAYSATMGMVFLMFLPALISLLLLLLVGGAIQLLILILRVVAIGLFRGLTALSKGLKRLHRHGTGGTLAPH